MNMSNENATLVLLDEGAKWEGNAKIVAHWTRYDPPTDQVSIPLRMEGQALEIKNEYLKWVHDVGRTRVEGKTVTQFLKVFDNLSYWWLTTLSVKSPFDSDSIHSVFKLKVLESLYSESECSELVYCGNDTILDEILKGWCEKSGHRYQRHSVSEKSSPPLAKRIRGWFQKCPGWIQVAGYLVKHWYLRYRYVKSVNPDEARSLGEDNVVSIVNYFPNFDQEKAREGEFYSKYWQSLHSVFDKLPVKINWIFFYYDTSGFSFKESIPFLKSFNKKSPEKNRYFILEEFLTFPVLLKALKLYLRTYFKGKRLDAIKKEFCFPGSKINFFPLMEQEWNASLFGNLAINNAVKMAMYDSMAKTLPTSPWSLFIWENQPWDMALMSAWRRHQKDTKILASQHGFFRPFDLRFISDSRDYTETGGEAIPLPDKLCINNSEGLSLIREAGFPEERIAEVEAVRFFGLKGKYMAKKQIPENGRTLLVIMGITDRENNFLFRLLQEAHAEGGLEKYNQVLIKPHPALSPDGLAPVYESKFEYFIKKSQSLDELWAEADVVYAAHTTGAAWEASWNGIPAIVTCAVDSLNLNPLSGLPGVQFVANSDDLLKQLNQPSNAKIPEDYFYLEEDLNRWKKLFNSPQTP